MGSARWAGVTGALGAELVPVTPATMAATVTVYETPSVSPVMTHEVDEVEQVAPPGEAVATYELTAVAAAPLGAAHDTCADASPAIATTELGGPGGWAPASSPAESAASTEKVETNATTAMAAIRTCVPVLPFKADTPPVALRGCAAASG